MPLCHKCGKEVPRKIAVYRTMKTGRYSGGSAFHRSVTLCAHCAEAFEKDEQEAKGKRLHPCVDRGRAGRRRGDLSAIFQVISQRPKDS